MKRQFDDLFYGSVTVGERGQIVIPAEARSDLGIKPGDKLLVMRPPHKQGLMITRIEEVVHMVEMVKSMLEAAAEEAGEEEKDK